MPALQPRHVTCDDGRGPVQTHQQAKQGEENIVLASREGKEGLIIRQVASELIVGNCELGVLH